MILVQNETKVRRQTYFLARKISSIFTGWKSILDKYINPCEIEPKKWKEIDKLKKC